MLKRAAMAVRALRRSLDRIAERRLRRVSVEVKGLPEIVIRTNAASDGLARRIVDAWNTSKRHVAVAYAYIDEEDGVLSFVGRGVTNAGFAISVGINEPTRSDRFAAMLARAALWLLPGGRR